jgi:hypothetical protein
MKRLFILESEKLYNTNYRYRNRYQCKIKSGCVKDDYLDCPIKTIYTRKINYAAERNWNRYDLMPNKN